MISIEELERRVRIPKGREVLGIILSRLGAGKMRVQCQDGKVRICRIPGRLKRKLWVREGNIVLVEPWEIQGDERGDVIWRYTAAQINALKKKGLLEL